MEARPLLKWAGGKRQLLPALRRFYPAAFGTYFEPFAGSAAVFFDLHAHGRLEGHVAVLADSNIDLIACYTAVRDEPEKVIEALDRLAAGHARRGSRHYYDVRDRQFNPERSHRCGAAYTPELAAMFIYLNRTGYNGLFRLNADGAFNVPAGRYTNPRICDAGNLRHVSAALQAPGVRIVVQPFDHVGREAKPGDFLYFDPPYAPLSRTASFTGYTAERFSGEDQETLRNLIVDLASRGCHVILSNSTAPDVTRLYEGHQAVAAAGLRCHRVPARRAINSNAKRRGNVEEYLITNVPQTLEIG
ncbi:MAG TPA: Dam family site-specific DNA-(adenine-N6)-methyltransferase [Vicinamibacterales bacterium]|nr:Dam family site-specific DNA-(adenine-N6)-methyltransferase [Vicinamibacterales bacterium]